MSYEWVEFNVDGKTIQGVVDIPLWNQEIPTPVRDANGYACASIVGPGGRAYYGRSEKITRISPPARDSIDKDLLLFVEKRMPADRRYT